MSYFIRKSKTKVYFLPTIANVSAPTQAELTAGTMLATSALADIAGFNSKSNFVDVPNFASLQTPKIPGEKTSDDSSLTFYEDSSTNPIATLLAQDTTGYILFANYGATTATSKVNVFPVQVASNTPQYSSGNEAAKFVVDFAITAVPTFGATMAA